MTFLAVCILTALVVGWTTFWWLHGHDRGWRKGYAVGLEVGARWRDGVE